MAQKYWLKGGLIFLSIPVLVAVADFVFTCDMGRGAEFCMLFSMIASIFVFIKPIAYLPFLYSEGWLGWFFWAISYMAVYFLAGVFIGWLYGKIKNCKNIINL